MPHWAAAMVRRPRRRDGLEVGHAGCVFARRRLRLFRSGGAVQHRLQPHLRDPNDLRLRFGRGGHAWSADLSGIRADPPRTVLTAGGRGEQFAMTFNGWLQIALYCAIVTALVKPFGSFMTHAVNGERNFLSPILGPVERAIYWCCGVDEEQEQYWATYAV